MAAATFLLAADGSPASRQAARLLAGYAGDRDAVAIELLNVQSRPIALWPEPGLDPGRLDEALLREGAQAVTAERAALSAAGFDAPVAVRLGFPAESIAEEALRRWATAIVMGTRGHGPVGGFAVGSVAMRVAHRAHVPTLLVQADSRLPASLGRELRVLVPLDGSVHGARAADEVRRWVAWAGELKVELLHVRAAPRIWETLRPEERAMLEEWGSAQAERATRAARALLHGASLPYRMHEATGDPAVEIVRCAARLDADLVVLGTRGLGALHHALVGSVALKVASASPVPVAVVP